MTPKNNHFDIVIVGGGVSGVYSAWRLKNELPNSQDLKIGLFEASNRIGGRLLSVTPPGMPSVRCELGGMRYLSSQKYVSSLIENKLRMKITPFAVDQPENIAFLRNTILRLSQLNDSSKVPYNLTWAEKGKTPEELLQFAIQQIVPNISAYQGQALMEYLINFTFEGKHLYDEGFWNLVSRAVSHEAFRFLTQGGGYDMSTANWNALDMILFNFDFAPDVKYWHVTDGYEAVPIRLANEFQKAGGELSLGHRLLGFSMEDNLVKMVFDVNGEQETVLAKKMILAMPKRSIELIAKKNPFFSKENVEFYKNFNSITPVKMFKMFIAYHEPWWENLGIKKGRSLTDLPIRQTYYWGTEAYQEGGNSQNRNSVLMATYDDSMNVDFWVGLDSKRERKKVQTSSHLFQEPIKDSNWDDYLANESMVDEMNRQLAQMHGLKYIPQYYSAVYQNWGQDPYGGAIHLWNIHAKSWEVIPYMVNPTKGELPIFICGEAYSHEQGWVEGALATSELMLQNYFGLKEPNWLNA